MTTHSATGGAETDVFGHPVTEVNYTFGKQESVGELYQKVLDAIDWYQQEKAARTQGQEYKAQTAVVGEGEDEIGRQSLSPTTELEEKVERLISRAERANSERTRNLQRIQQEAQQVLGTIEGTRWEETRWKFYELSKESTGINEAGQTPKQVIETDKGRIRTESGGSYQGEAGSETSREELKSRKETEKVDTEEILEPYLKPTGIEGGNPVDNTALGINEQSNKDLWENYNKTKLGAGGTVEPHQPGEKGPSDVGDREKIGDGTTVKELSAGAIRRSGEGVKFTPQEAAAREDVQTTTAAVQTKEGRRKVSRTKTVKPVEAPNIAAPIQEAPGNRTTDWVAQHQSQSVEESIEGLNGLRLSASSEGSGHRADTTRRTELYPLEVQSASPTNGIPGGSRGITRESSGGSSNTWGRQRSAMARMPNFKLPLFHGREGESYERFFDEMAGLMRISGWGSSEYLDIVKIGIKDGAATWLKAVPRDEQDSLEKVKTIIKDAFGDKRPKWQRHRDLHNLRQDKGQSVRDFALKIKEYAFPDDVDDGQLLSVFVAGLPRHIGMELAKSELTTLDKAVAQAVRIESVDKRGFDRKTEAMTLEMERNLRYRNEATVEINMCEFDSMMENQFMDCQPQGQSTQRGYNRGQGNWKGRSRYQNQGEYNNRIQGSLPSEPLNEQEYRQRSLARAEEYKRRMRQQTGGAIPVPLDKSEGERQYKYCLIHDSRTHTTAECDLLKGLYQTREESASTARPKQVTFVPTDQGN